MRAGSRRRRNRQPLPWKMVLAELAGTGILVAGGLSIVVLDFAPAGPVVGVLGAPARRALTGFLFGTVGALVAVSPLGKRSGAHLNPVVTLMFVLQKTMHRGVAAAYVVAQLAGATLGAAMLLAWRSWGASVNYGATAPGASYGPWWALAGEMAATFALVLLLLGFLGSRRLRRFTPLLFPVLYAVMVLLEAPLSGTSTNPARTVGPAIVAGVWRSWWVYWAGPLAGCLLAVLASRHRVLSGLEIEVAKVYHFAEDSFGYLSSR